MLLYDFFWSQHSRHCKLSSTTSVDSLGDGLSGQVALDLSVSMSMSLDGAEVAGSVGPR